ncbi:MAG: AI-2E family transporter [Eubacterium sp.]|nr:AI-2E family transporter [Eubacterium sp.]
MIKFFKRLDQKYLKICMYAGATVILTVAILFILSYSGGFWSTLWSMFTAVLTPVVTGFIICYLFLPIVEKLEKLYSKKLSKGARAAAVATFYLGVAVILGILIIMLFFALKGGIDSIRELNFKEIENFVMSLYAEFGDVMESLEKQFSASTLPLGKVSDFISRFIGGIAGFFSDLMFGVIFSIYFMLDEKNIRDYWGRVVRLINGDKAFEALKSYSKEADHVFSGYLRGQFTDALIVGILASVILNIANVPYGTVIGIIIGLGNLIPYVGPIAGYAAVILICLVTGQYDKLIIGVILVAVIMFVDGNIINPRLLSENVEVHPLFVIAALIAGGVIGGIVGMLIAVPTAAFIKLQFEKFLDKREKEKLSEEAEKSA